MRRVIAVKSLLWLLLGAAAAVGSLRFLRGLGATTALTDLTPWGFWIGFDVLGGVALAAGGFVLAAAVHVFHLERYHGIVRPAVLTAFLGYVAVVVALLFDLGLPWNIWHMIVFWNPHSPLFEVGWCVMLYSTVLALEFGPVVLEASKHPLPQKACRVLRGVTLPLVITGIGLSTLHQSSLGSLFLLMPHRLHPLWYTPVLPLLFLLSAVSLGLLMVILESLVSSYLYEREPELDLLSGLARAASSVLWVYAAAKVGDVLVRGRLVEVFTSGWSSALFVLELALSAIVPAWLLGRPAVRQSSRGLGAVAALGVAGFVLNRLDIAWLAMIEPTGTRYVPSWMELSVSLGVVAGAMLAYFFVAERFHLFHAGPVDRERFRYAPAAFDPTTGVVKADPYAPGLAPFSLAAIAGAALAFAFVPPSALAGRPLPPAPVSAPGFGERILLDGDRAGEAVVFDHKKHVEREGGTASCGRCHHLNRPGDQATGCSHCHRDMHRATSIFDHHLHADRLAAGPGCTACHPTSSEPKDLAHGKPCLECHTKAVPPGAALQPRARPRLGQAPGYVDAVHNLCVKCHAERAARAGKPTLGQCGTCHQAEPPRLDPLRPDERLL